MNSARPREASAGDAWPKLGSNRWCKSAGREMLAVTGPNCPGDPRNEERVAILRVQTFGTVHLALPRYSFKKPASAYPYEWVYP